MNFDCGIYSITSPSGKRYIGQAQSFKVRWAEHKSRLRSGSHRNRHLQNAWNKHGEGALIFSKIAIVPLSDLDFREQEQINAWPPEDLYNIALEVGLSCRGVKRSPETRAKISSSKKLQYATKGNPLKGRKLPPETIAKMSAAAKGQIISAEHRAKISAANKGRVAPAEERRKISESRIGRFSGADSPVARAVICVETGMRFGAASVAAGWLQMNGKPKALRGGITASMNGRQKKAYGYTWRYADDYCGDFTPKLSS